MSAATTPTPLTYPGLQGRVAIVTGAGQGIGRAFAKGFAQAGAIPVVADVNEQRAQSVAREIEDMGGQALPVHVDVGNRDSAMAMAARVREAYGRIDVIVNNAALFSSLKMKPFDQIPPEEWDALMRVNITGVFNCCCAVVPAMREAKFGRIINISSASIREGRTNYLHYTTSKSALIGMTRSLARELGASGITANAIMPGPTFTEVERETVTPAQKEGIIGRLCIPRFEVPEDLVGTTLFLASDGAAYLTGQTIAVDGGLTHG